MIVRYIEPGGPAGRQPLAGPADGHDQAEPARRLGDPLLLGDEVIAEFLPVVLVVRRVRGELAQKQDDGLPLLARGPLDIGERGKYPQVQPPRNGVEEKTEKEAGGGKRGVNGPTEKPESASLADGQKHSQDGVQEQDHRHRKNCEAKQLANGRTHEPKQPLQTMPRQSDSSIRGRGGSSGSTPHDRCNIQFGTKQGRAPNKRRNIALQHRSNVEL